MNTNFDFYNPTHILFGSGKLDELGNQPMPGKKALLSPERLRGRRRSLKRPAWNMRCARRSTKTPQGRS